MPVRPPDENEVAALAGTYGMHPDEAEVSSYTPLVAAFLTSYDAVEELYAGIAPQPPADRPSTRPADADNPLGAWYVRTEIRGAAEGPLAGRTVAVKDNVAVAGVPMMNGSHTVEGFVPRRDATVVTRLLGAGATVTGKAVCEDLCFSGGSHTSVTGPVRNPWDPTRTTGGSSSGSAALVAAGEVDLALGGDQGGSIRMPAAFCGIVGHKPTHGLVPYTGAFPIESTLDHLGPMTRTVADAATVLDVLAGRDGDDPRQPADLAPASCAAALGGDVAGLRVGVVAQGFGWAELSETGVDDTVRAAAGRLRELGIEVVDLDLPWHRHALHVWNVIATDGATVQMIEGNGYGHNWEGRYDPDLVAHYGRRRKETADRWSPTVTAVALAGRWSIEREQGRHYAMAQNLAAEVRRRYDEALSGVDLLVLPTVPMVARPIPAPDDPLEVRVSRGLEMIVNCAPFDVSGHPATSVPAGLSEGLPVGMMLVGRRFADATCLQVAHAFEQLVGGFPGPPGR
ncbi:amidase [Geodermatophilus bullaregiensis]|uniref:amidase n=1 Tax=Geodermatophilus bullaregiensis TaxID=1564160 RepID=UPI0019583961|nr:amidase [Geodermatophilus bullaregiensis]MBM7806919.1 amidase [Geodermatophilus bullaregiensis]